MRPLFKENPREKDLAALAMMKELEKRRSQEMVRVDEKTYVRATPKRLKAMKITKDLHDADRRSLHVHASRCANRTVRRQKGLE